MAISDEGTGSAGPRRRRWTEEEKARLVAECDAPGSSVSLVARRHDLNTNLLFTWRRQFRERQCGAGEISFVPAVLGHKIRLRIDRQRRQGNRNLSLRAVRRHGRPAGSRSCSAIPGGSSSIRM